MATNENLYLKALDLIQKNDWHAAHAIVQDLEIREAALIHAFLHRIEGDSSNARYWYRRAGAEVFEGTTEQEHDSLVKALTE